MRIEPTLSRAETGRVPIHPAVLAVVSVLARADQVRDVREVPAVRDADTEAAVGQIAVAVGDRSVVGLVQVQRPLTASDRGETQVPGRALGALEPEQVPEVVMRGRCEWEHGASSRELQIH